MPDIDDQNGSEIVEVFNDVYSQDDLQRILDAVCWRSEVPPEQIARKLQSAGGWQPLYRQAIIEEGRPSERERRLGKVRDKLCTAAQAVRETSSADLNHLRLAGDHLAKNGCPPPDIEPEKDNFVTIWDSGRQINASLERIDWLIRCVETAIQRSGKATHGSRPADDALHTTIWALQKVYFDFAVDPRTPGTDIGDDSADSRTYRKSELLDFLEKALRPLGVGKSREAIYGDWRRASAKYDAHD